MRWSAYIFLWFFFPVMTHAQVLITEIMYAPEGADSDREWVEVCAESEVDISGWKLYENDTNHGLSVVAGNAELAAGECAIIADDAVVFAAEHSSYTGALFDSAFSLSNTGEVLTLRDGAGADIDSVSYSSDLGAKDDGQTLHRSGTTFTAGTPTPGTHGMQGSEEATTSQSNSSGVVVTTQTQTVYEHLSVEPPQDVHMRVEGSPAVAAHSNSVFRAEVYNARGIAEESVHVAWNFGDGTTGTGAEVSHRYWYPGTYTLSAFAEKGSLSAAYTDTITVFNPQLVVELLQDGNGVRITNNAAHAMNLAGWRVTAAGSYFIFPEGTYIESENSVVFAKEVLHMITLQAAKQVQLYTPRGKVFAEGGIERVEDAIETNEEKVTEEKDKEESTFVQEGGITTPVRQVASVSIVGTAVPKMVAAVSIPQSGEVQSDTTENEMPLVEDIVQETQLAAAETSNILPEGYQWYVALAALMMVGVGGIAATRTSETPADTFTIVE